MSNPTRFEAQITFLFVADLERAAAFYGGLLGLELVRDQDACLIYRTSSTGLIGLCDHRPSSPGGVIVTLITSEVDHWAKRMADAGLAVDGPSHNETFGIYHCFVTDPDGHLVEVQQFDQPLA